MQSPKQRLCVKQYFTQIKKHGQRPRGWWERSHIWDRDHFHVATLQSVSVVPRHGGGHRGFGGKLACVYVCVSGG